MSTPDPLAEFDQIYERLKMDEGRPPPPQQIKHGRRDRPTEYSNPEGWLFGTPEQDEEKRLLQEFDRLYGEMQVQDNMDNPEIFWNTLGDIGRGFFSGTAMILGAPTDMVHWGLRQVGMGSEGEYFGGSESIKRGLNRIGIGTEAVVSPFTHRIGEALGGGTPLSVGLRGAAIGSQLLRNPSAVKKSYDTLLKGWKEAPVSQFGIETSSALSGGVAAAATEQIAPNNPLASIAAEMVGSVLNPIGYVAQTKPLLNYWAKRYVAGHTKEGQMDVATATLRKSIDDFEKVANRNVNQTWLPDAPLPPAIRAQDKQLFLLTRGLIRSSAKAEGMYADISDAIQKTVRRNADILQDQIDSQGIESINAPSRSFADDMRHFEDALQARIDGAKALADRRIRETGGIKNADDMAAYVRAIVKEIQEAFDDATNTTRLAWYEVPQNTVFPTTHTEKAFGELIKQHYRDIGDLKSRMGRYIVDTVDGKDISLLDEYNKIPVKAQGRRAEFLRTHMHKVYPVGKGANQAIPEEVFDWLIPDPETGFSRLGGSKHQAELGDIQRMAANVHQELRNVSNAIVTKAPGANPERRAALASIHAALLDSLMDEPLTKLDDVMMPDQQSAAAKLAYARGLTKRLHDTFQNSGKIGRVLGGDPAQKSTMDPERFLKETFPPGAPETVSGAMEGLAKALERFNPDPNALPTPEEAARLASRRTTVHDGVAKWMLSKLEAMAHTDKNTGLKFIDEGTMDKLNRQYQPILDSVEFEGRMLRNVVEDLLADSKAIKVVSDTPPDTLAHMNERNRALAQLYINSPPAKAINAAIDFSDTPEVMTGKLKGLWEMSAGRPDVQRGLRASFMREAFGRVELADMLHSDKPYEALEKFYNGPFRNAVAAKWFDEGHVERFGQLVDTMKRIRWDPLRGRPLTEVLQDTPGEFQDFLSSLGAVHMGSKIGVTQGTGPGALIINSRLVRWARQALDMTPRDKVRDILGEIVLNEEMFELSMARNLKANEQARFLNRYQTILGDILGQSIEDQRLEEERGY